jgi:hypothetical protein
MTFHAHIKSEGNPIHPDDTEYDFTDDHYLRQLQKYKDCYGNRVYEESCVRPELLDQLE